MIKPISFALVGAIIGIVVVVAAGYLTNLALVSLDIRLYASEHDQQRNFDIFLVLLVVSTFAGAWLGFRKANQSISTNK